MCALIDRRAIAAALLMTSFAAVASPGDAPADYSHILPLSVDAGQTVVQWRVPRDVYLNARSPTLDDMRIYDASGMSMPSALADLAPPATVGRSATPAAVFPVHGPRPASGCIRWRRGSMHASWPRWRLPSLEIWYGSSHAAKPRTTVPGVHPGTSGAG